MKNLYLTFVMLLSGLIAFAQTTDTGKPRVAVSGAIQSQTWTADNQYFLDGRVYVEPGQTLTINPGVVVKGKSDSDPNSVGVLVVQAGAKIEAVGTVTDPIIFTSALDSIGDPFDAPTDLSASGLWGGVVILGKACLNTVPDVQNIEGIGVTQADSVRTVYGNVDGTTCDDTDDSGALKYVSIRHAGQEIAANNELNGLSLGGVGSGTEIDYIEIIYNTDDGIEFFGGTTNVKHAIVAFVDDDSYDIDQGNRMKGQFWFVLQSNDYPAAEKGGEWDGADSPLDGTPLQSLELFNATFIGVVDNEGKTNRAIDLRANGAAAVHNSIFRNFRAGVRINRNYDSGTDSYRRFLAGETAFKNNHWYQVADETLEGIFTVNGDTIPNGASISVEEVKLDSAAAADNNLIATSELLVNPLPGTPASFPTLMLDPRIGPGIQGVVAMSDEPADGFFEDVDYPGAFAEGNTNWMAGWSALWSLGYLSDALWTTSVDKATELTSMNVYPNPNNGVFTLQVDELTEGELALVFVLDVMGREVARQAIMPTAGRIEMDIDLTNEAAGTYIVKVGSGNKLGTKQVVIR
ncbi:MAG: T9SS type A sorting domain-containing protein [Bacteroidota bacterium]